MSFSASNFLYSNSSINGACQGANGAYGSDGRSRTSHSKTWSVASSGSAGYDNWRDSGESFQSRNGKETMQNLNDRLACYLEKVRSLEEINTELEGKIKDWHKNRTTNNRKDYSRYEKAIKDLQSQLINEHVHGAKLTLQVENAKLACDDFQRKYDTEKAVCAVMEKDVEGLRKMLDNLTLERTDLEMDIEGMRKELIYMRMSHEADMKIAQGQQKGSSVNVELDTVPTCDLSKIIADMRKEFEAIIERNRQEIADWYKQQSTTVTQEVNMNSEALQESRNQIKDLKRTLQTLEIDLQAELNKKNALEITLGDTQAHSSEQLQNIQTIICQVEAELSKIRGDTERQNTEYKILLDTKCRLENEIDTYQRLIEGKNSEKSSASEGTSRKVKTIFQDVVNGRVVSTRMSEIPQRL